MGVGIVFLGLLVGMSVSLVKKKIWRRLIGGAILLALLLNGRFFQPKEFLSDANEFYYTDADLIRREMSGVLPDYIPVQMWDELVPPKYLAWYGDEQAEGIEVIVDRSHQNLIRTNFNQERMVEFAVADFPGWEVELDGQKVAKQIMERGNIAVVVPSGEHLVGAIFSHSPVRLWSDLASFLSLMIFIYLTLDLKNKNSI